MATTEVVTAAGQFTADVAGPVDGPVVVALHGFPQSRHTWRAQVPALAAAGYRVVAPDQRGYSPGVRPDPTELANYVIDELVGDVLAIAEAVGRPGCRFHLLGHDWGGAVAWTVADRHPDRLYSLCVLSRPHPSAFAAAMADDADGQQHRSRHHRAFHDPATAALLLADDARRLRRSLVDQGVPEAHAAEYLSVLSPPGALEAALAWYRAAGALARLKAGTIQVPTTYVWGDADATVGPTAASATGSFVTGPYELVVLPGAGHFLTDERPEQVTEVIMHRLEAS